MQLCVKLNLGASSIARLAVHVKAESVINSSNEKDSLRSGHAVNTSM